MKTLKVRVVGICCFVNINNGAPSKRIILPYDDMGHTETHIPFFEVPMLDVASWSGLGPVEAYTHWNGSVQYLRWELNGHRITIDSLDTTAPALWQTYSYERHVPSMKAVCPELRSYPGPECFEDSPPPDLIAGYFDISKGSVDAGPLEEFYTAFDPVRNWPEGRGTQSVDLNIPVQDGGVVISIDAFDTSSAHDAQIVLKPEAETVRIGNLVPDDLTGSGSGDSHEHFMLYYNLASDLPSEMPLPVKSLAPVNACSPTRWS
jgi:hypothetical protein